ncbi:MAG TPA: hypothetical protein VHG28_16410 [Longimicrobiaceae bacterium]|nr:hypothetical protein [Longimicrobiaceae bacterium]
MSEVQAAVEAVRFTPTELVLLHGDRFAGEAGMLRGKEELLTGAGKVSADQLAEAVLAALLLGSEQAGGIRLEARAKKALLRTHPPDGVRRLLDGCERSRPEVWQLLRKHIASALARRRETSND